jgi:hypothetical protein
MSNIKYLSPETKENIFHGLDRIANSNISVNEIEKFIDCIEPQLVAEWYNRKLETL